VNGKTWGGDKEVFINVINKFRKQNLVCFYFLSSHVYISLVYILITIFPILLPSLSVFCSMFPLFFFFFWQEVYIINFQLFYIQSIHVKQ
jgi:hypothetical protein